MVHIRSRARRTKRLALRESVMERHEGFARQIEREGIRERRLAKRMSELRLKGFDQLTPQERAIVIKASRPNVYGAARIGQLRTLIEQGRLNEDLQRIRANWKR